MREYTAADRIGAERLLAALRAEPGRHLGADELTAVVNPCLWPPRWDEAGKAHDWRNHVPEFLRDVWSALSADARIVAYVYAKSAADAEEWE